jgi:hypothetical protein
MTMMSWRSHQIGLALASWLALPAVALEPASPIEERIASAATLSRELEDLAPAIAGTDHSPRAVRGGGTLFPHGGGEAPAAKVPFESQVKRYDEARPWSSAYNTRPRSNWTGDKSLQLLSAGDAPALQALLKSESPEFRGVAAEALATLNDPEDAPRLGELLDDTSASAPALSHDLMSHSFLSIGIPNDAEAPKTDSLDWSRRWTARTVSTYARDGLKLITGREFGNKAAFDQWWKHNAAARHCLWYWQLRMQRTMDEVEGRPDFGHEVAERVKQVRTAKIVAARQIQEELKQLPPEVEAKIRLLTASSHAGGAPITGTEELFWPEAPALRLEPERLLDLLDRKNLWNDVDWNAESYNLFAERLGLWADVLFKPQHADHLSAALKRERNELWWSGKAALIIGISRLQPAAKAGHQDEVGTRDQILRDAAANEPDLFVKGACASELVRAGLPDNAAFLRRIAFAPSNDGGSPDVMQSILQALARPPLDKPKRELLADIVLDDRFRDSWTRPNSRMGDDMNRTYAIWAINAHAGRTLITDERKSALTTPKDSAEVLERICTDIERLREKP